MTEAAPEELVITGTYLEAKKMLDYVTSAALDFSVDLPTRQYVTVGQAVFDCEQVTATMATVTTGLPQQTVGGTSIASCPLPWQIVVEIAIVRCFPVPGEDGTPPSAQQHSTAAEAMGRDTHILMAAAESRAAERFGNVVAQITYPPPSGGLAATVARYTVAVSS